jgi:capsid protein
LALENEFAINGHENRISYIIGPGHTYRAVPNKSVSATAGRAPSAADGRSSAADSSTLGHFDSSTLARDVQHILDAFLTQSRWHSRQQESVRRRDRDGEAFLRFFTAPDGTLRVRFVEPDQIYTPPEQAGNAAARLGILTDPDDVETIRGYFIDGRLVDAAEIQHRKANADANCRRGIPLFYPVRKNLRRAEKLLRNMSIVAEIQSAIALIRKHRQATATGVQQFVASSSSQPAACGRQPAPIHRYPPGAILDTSANIDYDFPAAGIDAANFVAVLQAELRAIASRLVMPEFMLTSDASNANYSSTMVAEGPALRMFARLQAEQVCDDLEVMWRVVDTAIAAGHLPPEARTQAEIQAVPPNLAVRDQLKDTQRYKIESAAGILSPQTWSQLAGLDYDQEQQNLASHRQPIVPLRTTNE